MAGEKQATSSHMKKIVIIGPESTGKSTLSQQLAEQYATSWVPEYAREYLEERGGNYAYHDLQHIARGQLELEEAYYKKQEGAPFLFIDTDLYVMKVWSEFVFGKCETWILKEIAGRKYDAYLLCDTDLPWSYDPLREYPEEAPRKRLFNMYHDLLIHQHLPWLLVSGTEEERLKNAMNWIEKQFPL